MDDLFSFAEAQQKQRKANRPTREEVIARSSEMYDKFNKYITISKDEYMSSVLKQYDSLKDVGDEEFDAHILQMNNRNKMLLKNLDNMLATEIQKRKLIKEAKEKRRWINRIKNLFQRLFR